MQRFLRAGPGAVALAIAAPALGQPHQGDIELRITDGRIATYDLGQPERVFASVMGSVEPAYARDPGFDCEPGTFPTGSRVGFRLRDALRVWNGQDFTQIAPMPLEVAFSTLRVESPPTPGVVEGFTLAVGSNGTWHRHLEFTLLAPATPGTYLLTMELYSTLATIDDSVPFWVVFAHEAPMADLEAGVQWVRDTLVTPPGGCDPDFNGDGNVDQDDVACLAQAVAGDASCSDADPDFNADGNVDQDDIALLAQVVAGAPCE